MYGLQKKKSSTKYKNGLLKVLRKSVENLLLNALPKKRSQPYDQYRFTTKASSH